RHALRRRRPAHPGRPRFRLSCQRSRLPSGGCRARRAVRRLRLRTARQAGEEVMEVLGVDHLDLTVKDLAVSVPFYEKVLGALGFRRIAYESDIEHDINWANAQLSIGLYEAAPEERNAVHT